MQKVQTLQQLAIQKAKQLQWEEAITINQEILAIEPTNTLALNRLGLAYMQTAQTDRAQSCFEQVLKYDKSNQLAKKHLKNIVNKTVPKLAKFAKDLYFVEEPGKSKIVELQRLTCKENLIKLAIGQNCHLVCRNKYLSITTKEQMKIGTLPDDIAFRLTKLIERGNTYDCVIVSVNEKTCLVQIREKTVSKKNKNILSFPAKVSNISNNGPEPEFVLDQEVPFEVISSDGHSEELNTNDNLNIEEKVDEF